MIHLKIPAKTRKTDSCQIDPQDHQCGIQILRIGCRDHRRNKAEGISQNIIIHGSHKICPHPNGGIKERDLQPMVKHKRFCNLTQPGSVMNQCRIVLGNAVSASSCISKYKRFAIHQEPCEHQHAHDCKNASICKIIVSSVLSFHFAPFHSLLYFLKIAPSNWFLRATGVSDRSFWLPCKYP